MPTDEHRAPGRLAGRGKRDRATLAPPRPASTPRSIEVTYQVPPARSAPAEDRAAPVYGDTTYTPSVDETVYEPPQTATAGPPHNSSLSSYRYESVTTPPVEPSAPRVPAEPLHSPDAADLPAGHLNKQQQLMLLLQTIQLYDDEWKLASIQPKAGNVMRAYLVPRNHPLDLKTAFSKRKYLVILINDRGNIEVKQPEKRGPLQTFLSWFYGGG